MATLPDLSQSKPPIASAAKELIGPIGALIVTVGSLLSMAGTNSGTMLEGSRMLYALSLGRPRLRALSRVHDTFRTPAFAITIHALVALAMALGGTFATLAKLSAVARLATYLFTAAAVPRLRKLNEGFRVPGGPLVPILGVAVGLIIVLTLDRTRLILGATAIVVGALIYFVAPRTEPVGDEL
jgi:APA family basic amino acid/polyamine antiporter